MSEEIFRPSRWKSSGSSSELPTPGERTYCARPTSKTFPRHSDAGLCEQPVEWLGVRQREHAPRAGEPRPSLGEHRGRALGDLDAGAFADREQRVALPGQHGKSERTSAREDELLAGGQPARRQLRLSRFSLDLCRQGVKLELHEEVPELLRVGRGAPQGVGFEGDRQVRANGRQPPRQDRVLAMLAQALAHLSLDLVSPLEEPIEAAVLRDPLFRRDLPDARHPGDVVGAVSHEGQDVHDLRRRHPEELRHALFVEELLAAGVKHADTGARDELEHVLVRRDDDDVEPGFLAPLGERPDDVVGFVPRHLEDRDPVGRARPADLGDLDAQVLLHGGAVGLVRVVLVVADGPLGPVEGHGEILGRMLAEHLLEHRHEPVDRGGGLALPGRKAADRVVSAVDVGHGIHQVERRARFRHGNRILWRAVG